MNITRKPNGPDNDDDIAKVFAAQDIPVPDTLRQSVLHQATQLSNQQTPANKKSWISRTSWLSAAATIVVAVAVAPMLLTTPESSLDVEEIAAEAAITDQIKTLSESDSTPSTSARSTAREPALAPAPLELELATDSLQSSETATNGDIAANTLQRLKRQETPALMVDKTAKEQTPTTHRTTPDKWITHINQLIADGLATKARKEYRLFAIEHPDKAKTFTPDFDNR